MKEGDLILVSAEATGLGKPMEAVIDKIETFMGQTNGSCPCSEQKHKTKVSRTSKTKQVLLTF